MPNKQFFLTEEELYKQILLKNENIWDNRVNKGVITDWLKNFVGEVFDIQYEHQLALWLLLNFVYYNQEEVRHLCRSLFTEFIHCQLQERGDIDDQARIQEEIDGIIESTRFYQLGRPGESGSYILYYFRQENRLAVEQFLDKPEHLSAQVNTIVFVDDVTLSSNQAESYFNEGIDFGYRRKMLLTFISTDYAEKTLAEQGIEVISCIKLDDRNKCFSDKSNAFFQNKEHLEDCKKFAEFYGKRAYPSDPLGHSDGQYAFGFFYNTPDNSLPIFWSDMNGWIPVIKRYHKKLTGGCGNELGIFV